MRLFRLCFSLLLLACAPLAHSIDKQEHVEILQAKCLRIKSSYPFSLNANDELSAKEFDAYFSPQGLISDSKAYFNTVIDTTVKGEPEEYYKGLYRHFLQVEKIRNEFYLSETNALSFSVGIKTYSVPKQVDYFKLNIGDGMGPTMFGPKFYHNYTWSSSRSPLTLHLKFHDKSEWKKQFGGLWGVFRLLDSGILNHVATDSYILRINTTHHAEASFKFDHLAFFQHIRKNFDCP